MFMLSLEGYARDSLQRLPLEKQLGVGQEAELLFMALLYHLEFFQYVHGFCQRFESACWVANLIFHRDILSRFQEISWVSDLLECERLFKGGDCVSFLSILQMHSTTGVHNGSSKIPVEQKIIWCSKTLGEEVQINHSGTYMVVQ